MTNRPRPLYEIWIVNEEPVWNAGKLSQRATAVCSEMELWNPSSHDPSVAEPCAGSGTLGRSLVLTEIES